jgi:alkyl hydroperoxide reductase subunit AhpF
VNSSGARIRHNHLMALLSSADQEKLREAFKDMTRPVRVLFFTQTFECETCAQTRQILDELPGLSGPPGASGKISIEEVNLVLDQDRAKQYGVDRAPALALLYDDPDAKDSRIRFLGAPSGYEFVSLVQAVLLVGGRSSTLTESSRQRLAAVDRPITLQVFTTPT